MSCEYCNPKYRPLFETTYWRVYLDPEQSYLGRCRVILKRHAGTLSMLNTEEWKDFGEAVRRVELILTKAFEPKLFNWTCMVNNSYLDEDPDPHIHWHVRGRYDSPVVIEGVTFDDPDFGHHYDRARKKEVSEDTLRAIRARLLHYT
jgi:diadenosine tetraphosphate (Ap4A) HIT family hydrolase